MGTSHSHSLSEEEIEIQRKEKEEEKIKIQKEKNEQIRKKDNMMKDSIESSTQENGIIYRNNAEKDILSEFYRSTNGENWRCKSKWTQKNYKLTSWFGMRKLDKEKYGEYNSIICENHQTGIPPFLILHDNNLCGPIPSSIVNLSYIIVLALWDNKLTGQIPEEIGNMVHLQHLYLGWNELTGSIPDSIGDLWYLQNLSLNSNKLTSSIPHSISKLINLTRLDLAKNQLTGEISECMTNMTSLQVMDIKWNPGLGPVPDIFSCNLPNLIEINYGPIVEVLGSTTITTFPKILPTRKKKN